MMTELGSLEASTPVLNGKAEWLVSQECFSFASSRNIKFPGSAQKGGLAKAGRLSSPQIDSLLILLSPKI